SPMRRRIRGRSHWLPRAPAARRIWPANCSDKWPRSTWRTFPIAARRQRSTISFPVGWIPISAAARCSKTCARAKSVGSQSPASKEIRWRRNCPRWTRRAFRDMRPRRGMPWSSPPRRRPKYSEKRVPKPCRRSPIRQPGTSWNAPAILSWALRQTSCRLCCGRKSTNGAPSSRRWESKSIRLRRDRRSEAPPSISASERGDRLHHRNRGSECRNPDHACTIAIVWSRQRTADERVRKEGDRHRSRKASRFIEATADHCVCKQDEHEQHRAKRNRYVNPIDQVEVHPALLLPRVLQARHLLGNKTLDD